MTENNTAENVVVRSDGSFERAKVGSEGDGGTYSKMGEGERDTHREKGRAPGQEGGRGRERWSGPTCLYLSIL